MEILQPLLALVLVGIAEAAGPTDGLEHPWTPVILALLVVLAAFETSRRAVRLHRFSPDRDRPFSPPAPLQALHLGLFAALVLATGWVDLARRATGGIPVVSLVAALLPYVLMRLARTFASYEVDRAARGLRWSRGRHVAFHLRLLALPLLPILILNGVKETLDLIDALDVILVAYEPLVLPVVALTLLPLIFAFSPLLVRGLLGARPLEAGALRTRLEAYGRRAGFGPTEILLWDTGGAVSNALFIGILPRLRYVLITDALIDRMDEAAVEAVYAHEAGHGARRHTLVFLAMALAAMMVTAIVINEGPAIGTAVALALGASPEIAAWIAGIGTGILALAVMAAFFLGGIGWASRRFETEADIHAITTLEDGYHFDRALETIGLHLGVLRRGGGLRHFGIGRRLGLLNRYRNEPEFRWSFDRLCRRIKGGTLAVFGTALIVFAVLVPEYVAEGRRLTGLIDAWENARATRNVDDLLRVLKLAIEVRATADGIAIRIRGNALDTLGDVLLAQGDYEEAREVAAELRNQPARDEDLDDFNAERIEALLGVLAGGRDPGPVRAVARRLQAFVDQGLGFDDASLHETWSDLFLSLRAAGGDDPAFGDPRRYTPAGRYLHALETTAAAGAAPADQDLRRAAASELQASHVRHDLFRAATEGRYDPSWLP